MVRRSLQASVLPGAYVFPGGAVDAQDASDAHAAYVKDKPVSTSDICATIYTLLGIDPAMHVYDNDRPVPIAHGGRPIEEILA